MAVSPTRSSRASCWEPILTAEAGGGQGMRAVINGVATAAFVMDEGRVVEAIDGGNWLSQQAKVEPLCEAIGLLFDRYGVKVFDRAWRSPRARRRMPRLDRRRPRSGWW